MRRIGSVLFLILLLGFLFFGKIGHASVFYAASCSRTDVIGALGAASSGDTVVVPSGSCTWSSGITIPTGVKLMGAGKTETIISSPSYIRSYLNDNAWLEGFRFNYGEAQGSDYTTDWVIKDCYFGNTTTTRMSTALISAYGVYSGCYFQNMVVFMFVDTNSIAQQYWYEDDNLGSPDKATYIEASIFEISNTSSSGQVHDSRNSGRSVVRFCEIVDGHLYTHGARGSEDGGNRAARRTEWYRNTFTGANNPHYATWNRGGVQIQFDNHCFTASGRSCGHWYDTERIYEERGGGLCSEANTDFDTVPHPATETGFGCMDATGMGRDIILRPTNTGPKYPQLYSPGYFWGNKTDAGPAAWYPRNNAQNFIIEGRDFFLDAASNPGFGNGGVTTGTWENRPVCNGDNKYHGYWATDRGGNWNTSDEWGGADGALYVCDGAGTWELYYTPAPYPHPLLQTAETVPAAPSGFKFSQ